MKKILFFILALLLMVSSIFAYQDELFDLEDDVVGTTPDGWDVSEDGSNTIRVDNSKAHSGNKSIKFTNAIDSFSSLMNQTFTPGNYTKVRMYFYFETINDGLARIWFKEPDDSGDILTRCETHGAGATYECLYDTTWTDIVTTLHTDVWTKFEWVFHPNNNTWDLFINDTLETDGAGYYDDANQGVDFIKFFHVANNGVDYWVDDIELCTEQDCTPLPTVHNVSCEGDSITDTSFSPGWCEYVNQDPNFITTNNAHSGDNTTNVLEDIEDIKGYDGQIVLIGRAKSLVKDYYEYFQELRNITQQLKDDGQQIVLSTIPPCNIELYGRGCTVGNQTMNERYYNAMIRRVSYEKQVGYADLFNDVFGGDYNASQFLDGTHPNQATNKLMNSTLISAFESNTPFDCDTYPNKCYIEQIADPTGLINLSNGITNITLNSSSSCEQKCLLYEDGVNVVNFTSFPYIRTGLTTNNTYSYKFKAYNGTKGIPASNFSNTIEVTTLFGEIPCVEDWIPYYTTCTVGDNQTLYYLDNSSCGTFDDLPGDNSTVSSCNYCTLSYHLEETGCQVDLTDITYAVYDNYESCCALTGISADCDLPANVSIQCTGIHDADDLPGVVIDAGVEAGITFRDMLPLIMIVVITIGLSAYALPKLGIKFKKP